ncbi:MAG: baseplate J/gp47 family protein [Anaerolineae bacterium]|nr:baseplate J/gp47 family protein [Anaerolineae bacterium]
MDIITITATDTRYTAREALRRVTTPQALLILPADVEKGWEQELDYEVLLREAQERGLEVAWIVDDPGRANLIHKVGFPLFSTEPEAQSYLKTHNAFPPLRAPKMPPKPKKHWWDEEPRRPELPLRRRQPLWLVGLESLVLLAVLTVVGVTAFLSGPSAHITMHPAGITYMRVVPISVDTAAEIVDLQNGVVPSRRIGDEFESYVEVGTTGRASSISGYATGSVLFTNLLGQDYNVPEGTIVRTTSGSYPMRYATVVNIVIPAFGQAEAPIEALEKGPRGNVAAYQINLVEGVVGFAVRVTNPNPISGAESQAVPAVAEADRSRAWDVAAQQVMAQAYSGLQDSRYLEPGEFLPQQKLIIQAVPKTAYTHLVGEETPILGLSLRLLVTGQVVKARDAQAVAHRFLAAQLPKGYTLTDARFEYGEAAEEDVGPGDFTFYMKVQGYAAANISKAEAINLITGKSQEEAAELLAETFPLDRPPEITVKPEWFPYLPFMPIRVEVEVVPGDMATQQTAQTP